MLCYTAASSPLGPPQWPSPQSKLLQAADWGISPYKSLPCGAYRLEKGRRGREKVDGDTSPPCLEPRLTTGAVTLLQPVLLWSRRAGTRGGERRRQLCCGHGRSHHQETQPQRGRNEWWPKKEWEKLSVIHALNRRAISVQSSWKERLTRGSRGHARARAGCLAGTCHFAPK